MKITLDIPDGIICGFFNGVQRTLAAKVLREASDAPAADVAPVRHGRWETHYRSGTTVSKGVVSGCCDMWNGWKTPYCPQCGAKMDGGDNTER